MDRFLLFTLCGLVLAGFIVLASASSYLSEKAYGQPFGYVVHQLLAGLGLGIILFAFAYFLPYRWLKTLAPWAFLASLFLLVLVLIPHVGIKLKGASRWLEVGGFTFQPSELLKITFVFYLAMWFDARRAQMRNLVHVFLPFLCLVGLVSILLVAQPDVGSLGVILASVGVMYLVAGGSLKHVGLLSLVLIVAVGIMILFAQYRVQRLETYFHPDQDPQGAGFHVRQSLTAIATGGIFGKGLGLGTLKSSTLPEPMNDSIFAVVAEETGLIGVGIFLLLYFLFFFRSLNLAGQVKDRFGMLVMVGITSGIFLQAMMNIAAVSSMIPFIGVTLPLVSYGGSSYGMTLAALGVVFNVAKNAS